MRTKKLLVFTASAFVLIPPLYSSAISHDSQGTQAAAASFSSATREVPHPQAHVPEVHVQPPPPPLRVPHAPSPPPVQPPKIETPPHIEHFPPMRPESSLPHGLHRKHLLLPQSPSTPSTALPEVGSVLNPSTTSTITLPQVGSVPNTSTSTTTPIPVLPLTPLKPTPTPQPVEPITPVTPVPTPIQPVTPTPVPTPVQPITPPTPAPNPQPITPPTPAPAPEPLQPNTPPTPSPLPQPTQPTAQPTPGPAPLPTPAPQVGLSLPVNPVTPSIGNTVLKNAPPPFTANFSPYFGAKASIATQRKASEYSFNPFQNNRFNHNTFSRKPHPQNNYFYPAVYLSFYPYFDYGPYSQEPYYEPYYEPQYIEDPIYIQEIYEQPPVDEEPNFTENIQIPSITDDTQTLDFDQQKRAQLLKLVEKKMSIFDTNQFYSWVKLPKPGTTKA